MPKIYKSYNPLKKDLFSNILYISLLWFFCFFIISFMEAVDVLPYFGFLILSIVSLLTAHFGRNVKVIMSGLNGESNTVKQAKLLPSNYYAFTNVSIEYEGKISETDLIIVGDKGVFILEVKNHIGIISGKETDKEWMQFKVTKNGGKYTNPFYNPTKQVKTHVYRLAGILKEGGYGGWVQGVVSFSNPYAEVNAHTKHIPILKPHKDVHQFIEEFNPRNYLTKEQQKNIIKTIKKEVVLDRKRKKQ